MIRDVLYLNSPIGSRVVFASADLLCLQAGEWIFVIRYEEGRLRITDSRFEPGLERIAIAGY